MSPYVFRRRKPHKVTAPSGGGSDDYAFYCQGGYTGSGTVRMTDGSESDVDTKMTAASDGDIICVPSGSFTWNGAGVGVELTKNVLVIGAGIGNTIITREDQYTFYSVLGATDGNRRISGFTFQGNSSTAGTIIFRSLSYTGIPSGRWRVDHNHFNYTSGTRAGVIVDGANYGVVDHNTYTWASGQGVYVQQGLTSDTLAGGGSGIDGDFINSQPVDWSTDKFVFIEDNTFASGAGLYVNVFDSYLGGGRAVYRYNTCTTGCFFYNHWTGTDDMSAQVLQIYGNTFKCDAIYDGHIARIEAGTGVFYNNTVNQSACSSALAMVWLDDRRANGAASVDTSGPLLSCNGSRAWDGNASDASAPGWPCFGQIGRGPGKTFTAISGGDKQVSEPYALWNNGTAATCATGGACTDITTVFADPSAYIKATGHTVSGGGYGQGDVDYVVGTAKPGYTAPTYPHAKVTAGWS